MVDQTRDKGRYRKGVNCAGCNKWTTTWEDNNQLVYCKECKKK